MTGNGTQQDPYVVSLWSEIEQLSAERAENVYIKFADSDETSTIDFAGKTYDTIMPRGWHIDGNGWSLRNIDSSSPVFEPKNAAVTYIYNLHFVKCKVTDSVFVLDWPLYPGEWQRGLIKWRNCSFSIDLVNSKFTRKHTALDSDKKDYPMLNRCGLSINCEGNSRFSDYTESIYSTAFPTIKDSSIVMNNSQSIFATLDNSIVRGDYQSAELRGKQSVVDAQVTNLTSKEGKHTNVVVNSDKTSVIPADYDSGTTSEINDAAYMNDYDFWIGWIGSEFELTAEDFEQGSISGAGEPISSTTKIRTVDATSVIFVGAAVVIEAESVQGEKLYCDFAGYSGTSIVCNLWWYESGTEIDSSEYQGQVDNFRCCLKHSDNSTILPEELESCKITIEGSRWQIINGELTNVRAASAPLPPVVPVKQDEYIRIFDMKTPQNSFDNNGLAILCPTSCKVTEELNGGWSAILEHPIDDNEKYKYIKEGNLLKIRGQLFTINKVEIGYTGNSGKLTAWAEHVFYQLNDPWIPIGTDIVGTTDPSHAATGQTILAAAMNAMRYNEDEYMVIYNFSYASDLAASKDDNRVAVFGLYKWLDTKGMTPIEFIMGSDGFISSLGGELYRDNFYFSVDRHMEGALDDAFVIKAGLNIKSIRRTVDLSTFCTHFTAQTDDGYFWAVSWLASTTLGQYSHNIVREKMFSIDTHGVESLSGTDLKMMYLTAEGSRWFQQQCQPLITYSIDLKDLRKHPDYQDIDMFRFKVGDRGIIDDERLGRPIKLQITKTVTDALTGEVIQVQFGNTRSFTRSTNYEPIADSDIFVPQPIEQAFPLYDVNGLKLIDKNGKKIFRRVSLNE